MVEYTGEENIHRGEESIIKDTNSYANSMRLFGLPYQFISTVDPRMPGVSDEVGVNFMNKIMLQAPVVTIIPGKAIYLPGTDKKYKEGLGTALVAAAHGNLSPLASFASTNPAEKLRYYDFQEDYTSYMKYVNIMCRVVAGFMELNQSFPVGGRQSSSLQQYDWKNYRWNKPYYSVDVFKNTWYIVKSGLKYLRGVIQGGAQVLDIWHKGASPVVLETDLDATEKDYTNNYVQFYVDPSSQANESMGNDSQQSTIKSTLVDGTSAAMRELNFMATSIGAGVILQGLEDLGTSSVDAFNNIVPGNTEIGNALHNLFSVGTRVIKGENIILPDIYQSSNYSIDYTIDINLRSPYGNKYSRYMDVVVPLLHLLALVLPTQGTSNSYGSPFLVKVVYPGKYTCNLGLVESLSVTIPSNEDAYNNEGLPMEAHCSLRIKDLYSNLAMSPSNDPGLFANNTSLIEYLANLSGLSLVQPQLINKMEMKINNLITGITEIDDNIDTEISNWINRKLTGFMSL